MRRELKYIVREADRERLRARIMPAVDVDAHAAGDIPSYTVRSVYYDTPGLRDYSEKASGDEVRRKVRVRAYDAPRSGPVFLEVKRKHGAAVWKDRAALEASTAAALLRGAGVAEAPESERVAAGRFLFRLRAEHRRPCLLVTYDREPLVGRLDPSLRITFDRRLRVSPFPDARTDLGGLYREPTEFVLPGRFILEVKFDRVYPSWLRPIQAEFGLERQALSKYGMGMDLVIARTPWRFGRGAVTALAR